MAVAAYGVATLLGTLLVRPLTALLSTPKMLRIGGSCLITGFVIATIHLSITTVVLTALLLGASWALLHTSLQAWQPKCYQPHAA